MADSGQSNLGNYPLKDIPNPHPHDVLCGRGGGSNNWIGNSHWRMLVAANKQLYVTLPKRQKMLLSRSIVHAVRSQNPAGRFLQKDSKSDRWYDIGDQRAQEKTSQALREGAPELRTKLKDDKPKRISNSKGGNKETSESRSDEGGKSPVPVGDGGDAHSHSQAPSNPPSRAASGSVSVTAPQLCQQASNSSVGQVLPPATPAAVDAVQPMAPTSMPPPAMRPNILNDTHSSQQRQPRQAQQQQQQQHFHQHQQQHQAMAVMQPQVQNTMPQMMQHPQQMMNGAVYFPGPSMNPMPMYPAMMYNQQGMIVPVMSMMPHSMPAPVAAQGPNNNTRNSTTNNLKQQKDKGNGNDNSRNSQASRQQHQKHSNQSQYGSNHQQQQQRPGQHGNVSHFDQKLEGLALPPEGLEAGGLSFGSIGSIIMTENEMKRLEAGGTSFGTAMSFNNNNHGHINSMSAQAQQQRQQQQFLQQQYLQQQQQFMEQYQQQQQQQLADQAQQQQHHGHARQQQGTNNFHGNDKSNINEDLKAAPPPDGGLEPQGLSFGSVSLMSLGDAKLEPTGVSFGSAMSFKMTPDMVDGGLEGIGMSFGSMTLATTNEEQFDPQQNPHNIIPPPPSGPSAAQSTDTLPTLFHQNRSAVNLLDCSDTDSDDEEQSAQRSQHKSLEWEKMKSLVNAGNGGGNPNNAEPLPLPPNTSFPSSFAIPDTTTFARDFSQMSQLSVGDAGDHHNDPGGLQSLMAAAAMPPPPPKKQDDDEEWQNADLLLLKTQQSGSNSYGGGRR